MVVDACEKFSCVVDVNGLKSGDFLEVLKVECGGRKVCDAGKLQKVCDAFRGVRHRIVCELTVLFACAVYVLERIVYHLVLSGLCVCVRERGSCLVLIFFLSLNSVFLCRAG